MRPVLRAVTAAVLATVLTSVSTAAAHADRWWGRDAARDVTQVTFTAEPPPCGTWEMSTQPQDTATDLVGLSVVHGRDDVVLRAHYRDLTGFADRHVSFTLATNGRDFEVTVSGRRHGGPVGELWSAPSPPEEVDECGAYSVVQMGGGCDVGSLVLLERDVISVTVPRDCIGDPRWVRAGVVDQRTIGARFRGDVWGLRGTPAETGFADGPLSPRVRRSD